MTDDFLWGGINIRKFCRYFIGNIWMVIAVMIIAYLGLSFVDKHTYTPRYTSSAVVAVYPTSSSYRYHTIETISNLSSKTEDSSSVFNSDLFQSGFHNQNPSLQNCTIESLHIAYTDLLVLHATSYSRENAFKGIRAALDYYSQFSGTMTGAPEIKVVLGPEDPYRESGGSKIQNNLLPLCFLSGLMMAGLLLFMYLAKKTYKTERRIRKRYKDVRFFSLPFTISGSKYKKGILSKEYNRKPIKKLALEIKQVLHKCNKNTLLVTSFADREGGTAIVSELAREIADQDENVILIGTEALQQKGAPGPDSSAETEKHTLLDVLQNRCTVAEAMLYSEGLKVHCIPYWPESMDEDISYSIDDVKRVLFDCLKNADVVLVNGTAWYPSHDAQIWQEAVDASIALCRQDDADFFKVDSMLSDLQKGNAYFAGCVLLGF